MQNPPHNLLWVYAYPIRERVYMDIFKEVQWGNAQGERIAWVGSLKGLDKRGKRTCFLDLCLTKQKLAQCEANHEKSHMDERGQFAMTWASLFLQEQLAWKTFKVKSFF